MGKTSAVYFLRLRSAASLVAVAVAVAVALLALTGCQSEEPKDNGSASQSSAKDSCSKSLSTQGEQAVRRVSDASQKLTFYGDPQDAAGQLVAQYDSGVRDKEVSFCRIHQGSSVVTPEVEVRFSLVQEVPEPSKDSIVTEYRMGESASAGVKVGILYFECTSKKLSLGAGATVLVHGVSRVSGEVTEPEDAARQDNLRIIYESSRFLSKLLGCKSNAGLPTTFAMPPEA
jgi:hypothetical protein